MGVAPRRIPLPHDPHSRCVAVTGALPAIEEVRDDRKQIALAIERLDQEVIQRHPVDRVDRELEVGVPAQQHRSRFWMQLSSLPQQVEARHPGRMLVGDQEGYQLPAVLELAESFHRRGCRIKACGPKSPGSKTAMEVALERFRHTRVAPHSEQYRLHFKPVIASCRRC
jgi:hypothetical protein